MGHTHRMKRRQLKPEMFFDSKLLNDLVKRRLELVNWLNALMHAHHSHKKQFTVDILPCVDTCAQTPTHSYTHRYTQTHTHTHRGVVDASID